MRSSNATFKQLETNQFYNTRSINTHQLKRRDFKTEIEQMFIGVEPAPKCRKTNFKKNQTFRNQNICQKPPPYFSIPLSISLFLSLFSFLSFLFPALLSSPTKRTISDLKSHPNESRIWLLALHQSLTLIVKLCSMK